MVPLDILCAFYVSPWILSDDTESDWSFMSSDMLGQSFKIVEQEVPNLLWKKPPWLAQISLAATVSGEALISPEQAGSETRKMERDTIQKNLVNIATPYGQVPSLAVARHLNPHPAVLPVKFLENFQLFHEALASAIENIIER
ncbi:hypothetical protein ACJ41O_012528 [Fusarium nematophilum]